GVVLVEPDAGEVDGEGADPYRAPGPHEAQVAASRVEALGGGDVEAASDHGNVSLDVGAGERGGLEDVHVPGDAVHHHGLEVRGLGQGQGGRHGEERDGAEERPLGLHWFHLLWPYLIRTRRTSFRAASTSRSEASTRT